MRRLNTAILAALACACAAVPAASASTSSASSTNPPRAQLQGYACQRALDPPNRSITVKAVMRPVAGTRRLAVKFALLERTPGSSSQTVVRAAGLNAWITPKDPTLGQRAADVWVLSKPVYNLEAPATYRFQVSFRWTGAHGKVLQTTVRHSPRCTQRELRPDLLVDSITVSSIAGQPRQALYTAVIGNRGGSKAGPFEVLFTPGDGSNPQTQTIGLLRPGQTRTDSFVGPACDATEPPTVTVDATDEVDDSNRANNEKTAVCPATSSSRRPTKRR
ncbi:MAG: CARDB domain-containing protein [Solirubrobacteraceae bacterium]